MNYPKKLWFLINYVNPSSFEFNASIRKGDIIEGTFEGEADERDYDGTSYGLYSCAEIEDYPLLVSQNEIDSMEDDSTHHSFSYFVFSSPESAKSQRHYLMSGNPINENKRYKMKQRIRLTESQLHNVIKESVKRILREYRVDPDPRFHDENGNQLATSVHGTDPESWRIMAKRRQLNAACASHGQWSKDPVQRQQAKDRENYENMRAEQDMANARELSEATFGGKLGSHKDGEVTPHGTIWIGGKEVSKDSQEARIYQSKQRTKRNYPNGSSNINGKDIKNG